MICQGVFRVSWNIAVVSSGDFCVSGMAKDVLVFSVSGTIMVMISTWGLAAKVCPCVCLIKYVLLILWCFDLLSQSALTLAFLLNTWRCCYHLLWVGELWFYQSLLFFAHWLDINDTLVSCNSSCSNNLLR